MYNTRFSVLNLGDWRVISFFEASKTTELHFSTYFGCHYIKIWYSYTIRPQQMNVEDFKELCWLSKMYEFGNLFSTQPNSYTIIVGTLTIYTLLYAPAVQFVIYPQTYTIIAVKTLSSYYFPCSCSKLAKGESPVTNSNVA